MLTCQLGGLFKSIRLLNKNNESTVEVTVNYFEISGFAIVILNSAMNSYFPYHVSVIFENILSDIKWLQGLKPAHSIF